MSLFNINITKSRNGSQTKDKLDLFTDTGAILN